MLTKGPGALDPFCAFQSPDCDDAIENLIKARFVGGLRGQDTPANSVFNFMQNRHPRAARAWFPKDATPFRVALIERLMAFSTSIPSLPALSSNPPRPESIPEFELGINNSLDPYTTAVGHIEHKRRALSAPVMAAIGGLLVGSLAVALWWGNRAITAASHDSSTATLTDLATVAMPAPSLVPSAVPESVRIELSATPADAQWWLDGVLLGSSAHYYGHVLRDQRTHVLTARAPEHEPRSLTVYVDRDVSLSLALERSASPKVNPSSGTPKSKAKLETNQKPIDSDNPYGNPE